MYNIKTLSVPPFKLLFEKNGPIVTGLLACVLAAMAMKFQLIFKLKIGWDEFGYLSKVHTFMRDELSEPFQSFHVHFFTWLPVASHNEVTQVIAARVALYVLFAGSCWFIYLIGKHFLNRPGALFSILCYVSLSNVIFHGVSFRTDSICSFLFLLTVWLIVSNRRSHKSAMIGGAVMALSLMISIKVLFHLLAIGGVFACLLLFSDNRKQTAVQMVYFSGVFVIILFLLYVYHISSLAAQPSTRPLEFAGKSGSKVIMLDKLFFMFPYFLESVDENLLIWFLLFLGILVIFWDGVRHRKWLCSPDKTCLMYSFLIPLLTLVIYRNAFPYYYVFIMAPAVIFCGVIMHNITEKYKTKKSETCLFFAGIVGVAVFCNFLFHYSKVSSEQLTAQKNIIQTVHQIFPEPVPYIDGCSVISSFPKVGIFMSTWGMEDYLQAGKPIMRHLLETRQPLFLVANLPSLDFSLPRENRFTEINLALMEEDWHVLNANFIPHWGIVYVAGKKLTFGSGIPLQTFEILIPGTYTIETKGPVKVNGIIYPPGSMVDLKQGDHVLERLDPEIDSVTLRWGKNLFRPDKEPELIPMFYGSKH